MLLNSKKQCQGHFGQVEMLLRDAAVGKQCWCQLRGAAQENWPGMSTFSQIPKHWPHNRGIQELQPHPWRRPGATAQGFPLRLLHTLTGSARQQHKAHAEHTRLPWCSLAWSSATQRKQEQLPCSRAHLTPGTAGNSCREGLSGKRKAEERAARTHSIR